MVLAGHFERGGEGARAASYYLRAAEQAFHVLDLGALMTRADLGLTCAPPEELRIALLGLRCEASIQSVQLISGGLADAEELMRSAPRGSVPWAQGLGVYCQGMAMTGRIGDLLAALGLLREVDPAPEAVGRMALAFLIGICILDGHGQVSEGTSLEARFFEVVRSTRDRDPLALFWRNVLVAIRAAYAHEDPWLGLEHSEENQTIFDAIGGERTFLVTHLYRGMNFRLLGAYASAERALKGIEAADELLGLGSSLRRLVLCWLHIDRGALDEAHVLASELREYGRAHHLPLEEGKGRWVLAEVLRRLGDLEGAERELEPAFAMAVPLEHPAFLGTLSALRLAQGRAAEALAAAEDAIARCDAMGGCGMSRGAFVRLARAEALHATGAHDAARNAIAEARTRLRTIAGRIPDPAYKQSFLEDVPENARTFALARAWLGGDGPR
jgi:hypothetical protein